MRGPAGSLMPSCFNSLRHGDMDRDHRCQAALSELDLNLNPGEGGMIAFTGDKACSATGTVSKLRVPRAHYRTAGFAIVTIPNPSHMIIIIDS